MVGSPGKLVISYFLFLFSRLTCTRVGSERYRTQAISFVQALQVILFLSRSYFFIIALNVDLLLHDVQVQHQEHQKVQHFVLEIVQLLYGRNKKKLRIFINKFLYEPCTRSSIYFCVLSSYPFRNIILREIVTKATIFQSMSFQKSSVYTK